MQARESESVLKDDEPVRVQVLLARSGVGSRRSCEELIAEGRVTVDGEVVTELGTRVARNQKVALDGELLRPERTVYYLVNKPKGVLCTNADPRGRSRVIDLFPKNAGRLYPVGRLDEETVGLLLVTNDGSLSHQLAHPSFRVPKKYLVHVAGLPAPDVLDQLRRGMYFSDGKFKVEGIRTLKTKGRSAILELILNEGQNREIRRLFARVGHKVLRLERIAIGPLKLGDLPEGHYRPLTPQEVKKLRAYLEQTPEQREKAQPEIKKARPKKRTTTHRSVSAGPSIVEVSAVTRRGGRDFTGQNYERGTRRPPHPALGDEPRSNEERRPRTGGNGPRTGGNGPRSGGNGPRTGGSGPRTSGSRPANRRPQKKTHRK